MYGISEVPKGINDTGEMVFILVSRLHSLQFNLVWQEKSEFL